MARQPTWPRGRRGRIWPGGLRRRLVVAFVLVATVSAGALAVASYLLVRDARLDGSLAASAAAAREDLNLAIALENARLLGGNISVSSDVAGGSVFRLTLPLGPAADVSEP